MKVVLSWLLFWIGHGISIPMQAFDWAFLYRPYCWLMATSQDLDEHEKVWTRYHRLREQRAGDEIEAALKK